ncbi:type 4a pilus biogenesis protein PilO [Patescibacteria group bacterium]|nr:type 4a pilus biogenesis protein PilO [Patescibacteria group bacterium]
MAKIKEKRAQTKWYRLILVKFSWPIVIIFFLVLASINYFTFFQPQIEKTKNQGPLDVAYYRSIIEEQKIYLGKLQSLQDKIDKIDLEELSKLDYVLADKIDVPSILNHISALSKQSNMELTNFGFNFTEPGVVMMDFGFKQGTYQKVKNFIQKIEKNIRVMDIVELSFQNVGNALNLKIKTYYLENNYEK